MDGRFRVACALKALWFLAPGGKVMLHDWERQHYQVPLLRFYDLHDVTSSGHLGVLVPKQLNASEWEEAALQLAKFGVDPA